MFKRTNLLMSLFLLIALSAGFYSCEKQSEVAPKDQNVEQSVFEKLMNDNTQVIQATDLGEGTYEVMGKQGTIIEINDALVNAKGERVRGDIEITLVEIYTVADMIKLRKQTLADYDGQRKILESGGELFIEITQDGEKLQADGNGTTRVLLPTENTGGAKEGMEIYNGVEIGEQVIWMPTGEKVEIVREISRSATAEYYQVLIDIFGWLNVDFLGGLGGENVDCIELIIDCDELCEITPDNSFTAIYVNSANSAVEMDNLGGGAFSFCGPWPLGGLDVTFVVVVECDGVVYVAIITVTVTPGTHHQVVTCDEMQLMTIGEYEMALAELTP